MKSPSKTKTRREKKDNGRYKFRLFIVNDGPNSKQAIANLRDLCSEFLPGRHTIEIIDVVKNFAAAVKDNILITPALILVGPLPRMVILGNLSDRQAVLLALRLPDGES